MQDFENKQERCSICFRPLREGREFWTWNYRQKVCIPCNDERLNRIEERRKQRVIREGPLSKSWPSIAALYSWPSLGQVSHSILLCLIALTSEDSKTIEISLEQLSALTRAKDTHVEAGLLTLHRKDMVSYEIVGDHIYALSLNRERVFGTKDSLALYSQKIENILSSKL